MTTYQDQPLSRRAIREREQAEAARAAEGTSGAPSEASDAAAPRGYGAPGASSEPLSYITQGRAPLPQYDAPITSQPAPPAASEAPVQSAPAQSAPAPSAPAQPSPAQPADDAGDQGYRFRDFSPEGRRASRLNWSAPASESADLSYRTENRPPVPTDSLSVVAPPAPEPLAPEAVAPEPVGPAAVTPAPAPPEAALSRRELRALREANEQQLASSAPPVAPPAASVPPQPQQQSAPEWLAAFAPPVVDHVPEASAPPAVVTSPPVSFDDILEGEIVDDAPPPLVEPVDPHTDNIANLEALFRVTGALPVVATAEAPTDPPPVTPALSPFTSQPPPQASPAPVQPDPSAFAAWSAQLDPPSPFQQASVPAPAQPGAPSQVFPTFPVALPPVADFLPSTPIDLPADVEPEPVASTSVPPVAGERPRNHWSRQAELDDEAQPATGSLSRDVGVGPATANALVLPEIPNHDLLMNTVTSTGEVLVTGSISLPSSLSATGALATQLDESDLDHLLDPGDHQVASTDSQPVRAIRAVSTHTSSREIIGTIKPRRGNRALTALIIAAAGMALVVVTLLVVALANGVLG